MRQRRTVVKLRGHRRAALLDRTLRFWESMHTGDYPVEICLMLDRPTPDVRAVARLHSAHIARQLECPFPILSFEGGDRFMEAANVHLAECEALEPNWVVFADDDRWFEPSYHQEHRRAVDDDSVDCWYARSLFFWDDRHVRTDFFDHNSVALFRHRPGDRFDHSYNQAPAALHADAHRLGRTGQLSARLLDFGYASRAEREACFRAHAETGRLDQVVNHLLDANPTLLRYDGPTEPTVD